MAGKKKLEISEEVENDTIKFLNKLSSDMYFDSNFTGELLAFEWVDKLESACPYLDIIVRNPKLTLIKEENVTLIEKSKRIEVSSIKDLAKHTERINRYDHRSQSVEPKKILDIRNEETFNTYENRLLYTVLKMMDKFIYKKELMLKDFELKDNKTLEYSGSTVSTLDKINIKLKITSESLPTDKVDNNIKDKLKEIKQRIKRIKEYMASWDRSPMMKELSNLNIPMMKPPIRKTNVILKNPNFQVAMQIFEYLYQYLEEDANEEKGLQGKGSNVLLGFLDHSFLIDYFVMNAMSNTKREQKNKMASYALVLISEEIRRIIELLRTTGYKISDEELMSLIAKEMKNSKSDRLIGIEDVKKKFKSAMDEYLERTQDYL